jgi:hypothetical protein
MQPAPDDANAARAAAREYTDWVLSFPNVHGCGVGRRTVGGRETDEWALVVFVTRKLPLSALRSDEVVPRQLDSLEGSVLTDVIEVAEPRFHLDTAQYRPLIGGCQIGVPVAGGSPGARGAGTLGAILYDAIDYQPVLLTCNHVVTAPGLRNVWPADLRVFQPASGATSMGQTKRIVPWTLAPLGADYAWDARVDAAVIDPNLNVELKFEVIDVGKHPYVFLPPYEGLEVVKRGAQSDLTEGTVKFIDVTVRIPDFDGKTVKFGGVDSGFAIQRLGAQFSIPGDSGSLVVDKNLGATRGMVVGGDNVVSGFSYACEMGAIVQALQLETPCMGGLHSMIMRAALRRGIVSPELELPSRHWAPIGDRIESPEVELPSVHRLLWHRVANVDRFRERYLPDAADGRIAGALGSTLQMLATDLAEAIYGDEDFAGLLDEAFGEWLILPTIYDMLEYRLPEDFGQRVLKAFDRLREQRPEVEGVIRWMEPAFSGSGGMKMRELLERRDPSGTEHGRV